MRLMLALAMCAVLGGCRPVVRACSAADPCPAAQSCVGGRCQLDGKPVAIADTQRVVLSPRRLRRVESGGVDALLFDFDLRGLPPATIVEAHVLGTLVGEGVPGAGSSVHLYRMASGWDERSTSPASALGHVGRQESEVRLQAASPTTVRLQISSKDLRDQAGLGWALRLFDGPEEAGGVQFAEGPGDGPRLELYLRKAETFSKVASP